MGPGSAAYRRVVLSGFMGAGKTTVGRLVAARIGWTFLDADQALVDRAGMTIAELFASQGEIRFRGLEAEIVQELLRADRAVIALGGGTLELRATRDRLLADPDNLVVFLEASLSVSIERCQAEPGAAERPVLRDPDALGRRFESRLAFYRETARLTLQTAGQEPAALARRIAEAATCPVAGQP